MCRPKHLGGRRCPSHSDPEKIAARNAVRRARYQAAKNSGGEAFMAPEAPAPLTAEKLAKLMGATSESGALVTPAADPSRLRHPIFRGRFAGYVAKSDEELYTLQHSKEVLKPELNVAVKEAQGELVEMGYLAKNKIRGTIDHTALTEESYLELGFTKVEKTEVGNRFRPRRGPAMRSMEELSVDELQETSTEEKLALRYFTSENYRWLNKALFDGEVPEEANPPTAPRFTSENLDFDEEPMPSIFPKSKATALEAAALLDSAFEKAPKEQRLLYRGVSINNGMFRSEESSATVVEDWIDSNIALGGEVVFDGYQSASPDFNTARGLAHNGIVYEILTPEGLNVTDVSCYPDEAEVLLPRKERYMVAGVHRNVSDGFMKYHVVQLIAINENGEVLDGTNSSEKDAPFTTEG